MGVVIVDLERELTEKLNDKADDSGWNDASKITVLTRFITERHADDPDLLPMFDDFLVRAQKDEEEEFADDDDDEFDDEFDDEDDDDFDPDLDDDLDDDDEDDE